MFGVHEAAMDIEEELEAAAAEVAGPLRTARGLELASSERLKRALRAAAEAWSGSPMISKSAAMLFVDLASAIDACSYAYDGDDAERIRLFADEVADLVELT